MYNPHLHQDDDRDGGKNWIMETFWIVFITIIVIGSLFLHKAIEFDRLPAIFYLIIDVILTAMLTGVWWVWHRL